MARECIGMRARMLDRAVTGVFNAGLEGLGVKLSQLNVVIAIAKLQPAAPSDVARALHLEASTLSRNAERLRASGFVAVVDGDDARSRRYALTAQGEALIEAAYPVWCEAQRAAKKLLGDDGTEVLMSFARTRPFDRTDD